MGQANHFTEVWLVLDSDDNLILMGTDKGVVSMSNMKYRMSGVVTDAAPQYEDLIGRKMYMRGQVILGDPIVGPGIFRIN